MARSVLTRVVCAGFVVASVQSAVPLLPLPARAATVPLVGGASGGMVSRLVADVRHAADLSQGIGGDEPLPLPVTPPEPPEVVEEFVPELSSESVAVYRRGDGRLVSRLTTDEATFRDPDTGVLVPVDPKVEEGSDGVIRGKGSRYRIEVRDRGDGVPSVRLDLGKGAGKVDIQLEGSVTRPEVVDGTTTTATTVPGSSTSTAPAITSTSSATTSTTSGTSTTSIGVTSSTASGSTSTTRPAGIGGPGRSGKPKVTERSVRFELPAGGAVEYEQLRLGVKETVVLASAADGSGYQVRFELPSKLEALERDGAVVFVDRDGLERLRYSGGPAIDAEGARSEVTVRLVSVQNRTVVVEASVDAAWLAGAVYPVALDPSTVVAATADDTYIDSGATTALNGSSPELRVGFNGTGVRRALMRFPLLQPPAGYEVDSIMLRLEQTSSTGCWANFGVVRPAPSPAWTANSTWANTPAPLQDTPDAGWTSLGFYPQTLYMNVTAMAVYLQSQNDGFMLKAEVCLTLPRSSCWK